MSAVFKALAGGVEDAASKPALASLLITIWHKDYEDERDARFINDRVHANIQKDGTFSVIPEMPGGVCTPDELRRIADVAVKYNVPLVKVTGGQRIDLVGVAKDELPDVWRDLGMPAGYAWGKSYRTCKSCIGSEFCRFGLGDSMGLALKIERRFRGIDSPGKLKLATAGCPRNCSEALIKDVGAVAIGDGKWEIYVGGAGGSHVRKGDLLCVVDSEDDVLRYGRPLHAVLPREREVQGTHLHVRRARRASNAFVRWWSTIAKASQTSSMPRCRHRSRRPTILGRRRRRRRPRTSSRRSSRRRMRDMTGAIVDRRGGANTERRRPNLRGGGTPHRGVPHPRGRGLRHAERMPAFAGAAGRRPDRRNDCDLPAARAGLRPANRARAEWRMQQPAGLPGCPRPGRQDLAECCRASGVIK